MDNLLNILESLPVAVIAHDLKRKIFFMNKEAEKITGFRKEEVIGRDCHSVFKGGFCGHKCSFNKGIILPEFESLQYNVKLVTKDGNTKFLETKVSPIFDGKKLIGVSAVFNDITEDIYGQLTLQKLSNFHGIIGASDKMQKLYAQIRNVAKISVPVLILGESGTGKELVAQTIHKLSSRKNGPFVAVNCGALPDSLIESELFGYVKGAFTGAVKTKKGRFEMAHGGTLFLDEIGDVSSAMQVKLLRAIQTHTIERLGDEKKIRVDIRIISATNKDLKTEIEQGRFREDLFYRISVIPIELPPLRERKEDIPLLVNHFLKEFSSEFGMETPEISPGAMDILKKYSWPGNIRELQNVIQYALVDSLNSAKNLIEPYHLPEYILEEQVDHSVETDSKRKKRKKITLEELKEAIKKSGNNKLKAAKLLGISRATLYRLMDKFDYKDH